MTAPPPERPPGLIDFILSRRPLEWALPVAVGGAAMRSRLSGVDLALDHFNGRTVGIAVIHRVDVALRTQLLFQSAALLVVGLLATFAVGYGLSRLLHGRWPAQTAVLRRALEPAHALAALSLGSLAFIPGGPTLPAWWWVLLNGWGVAAALALGYAFPALSGGRSGRTTVALHLALVLAAWTSSYAVVVLWLQRPALGLQWLAAGWATTVLFVWPVPRLLLTHRGTLAPAARPLTVALGCLVAMPLAGVVAQELGYAAFFRGGLQPGFTRLIGVVVVALGGCGLALALLGSFRRHPVARTVGSVLLPLAIAAVGLMRGWIPAGTATPMDFFHDGEAALPAHQLLRFGALPYLDLFPTHGLVVSYLGGLLHALLDGFVAGDARNALGRPLLYALGTASLYFLVRRMTGSALLAALLAVLWPAPPDWFLLEGYAVGFWAVIALGDAAARGSPRAYWKLGGALVALLMVRVDTGLMAVLLVGVSAVALAVARRREGGRAVITRLLVPALAPAALAGLSLLALMATRPAPLRTLAVLREFLSVGFQSMSVGLVELFSPLVSRPVSQAMLMVMPALTVVAALPLALRCLRSVVAGQAVSGRELGLVTAVGYNLLLLTRATGRHTEGEFRSVDGFVSSFSVLLFLLLAWHLLAGRRTAFAAAAAGMFAFQMLCQLSPSSQLAAALAATGRPLIDRPQRQSDWSPRYPQPAGADLGLGRLEKFTARELRDDQTLLDLAHAPLLYVALDRRFPGYLIPTLYAASEVTQRDLVERASHAGVGMAVLRGVDYWAGVDGVADSLRSVRVHEWVHDQFRATSRVGPYLVATAQKLEAPALAPAALPPPAAQLRSALEVTPAASGVQLTATGPDPYFEVPIPPVTVAPGQQVEVDLTLAATQGGRYQIFFGAKGEDYSELRSTLFQVAPASAPARMRVLSSVNWPAATLDRIRFDVTEGEKALLERVAVGAVDEAARAALPEELDETTPLGWLAWAWANRDPLRALERLPVAVDLLPSLRTAARAEGARVVIAAGDTLRVDDAPFPTAGARYVHLRIQAAAAGVVELRYAKEAGAHTSGFTFDVVPGEASYLVRVGGQRVWGADPAPVSRWELSNRSAAALELIALDTRAGD